MLYKQLKYYKWDIYLVRHILLYSNNQIPRVLDVGCGIGHYARLFDKIGAIVTAMDIDENSIKIAKDMSKPTIKYILGNAEFPKQYINDNDRFDIIFISGLSIFNKKLDTRLMSEYKNLLNPEGIIIFIHNTNLKGTIRKDNWINYKYDTIENFIIKSNLNIIKYYFYDRHIISRFLAPIIFNNPMKQLHMLISKFTGLPCNLVFICK